MEEFLSRLAEFATPPPMPPEAVPAGLLAKAPVVHSALEIAWKAMGYQMFCNGFMVGIVSTAIVAGAVVFRGNLKALILGAAAHALK